ncbi:hypothetical protein [Fructilactobacillus cliffordii]|uniref:Uncharacterized protein n=1 Tax=Fructilactobacillus cliffordii TaxID=2940299 RepID=A0A9Q9DZY3_9LACO|nr:hypothetical protein [Fructilactobacillus cliffordii]USS86914.1 hypothetical protein M3M38_02290 [Fructilactobacillus cliffordii]USS88641.1 hypothetical protein M3M40_03835 [Fructilactobacillus cliffordii]
MEAETLAESLIEFTTDSLVEVLCSADILADSESVPEPLKETESDTLFSSESLVEVD